MDQETWTGAAAHAERVRVRTLRTAAEPDGTDVVRGLSDFPKTLPPRYFYDDAGSRLFDRITALDEYYPTRTEQRIIGDARPSIALATGPADLIELGSGSASKTRALIEALLEQTPRAAMLRYVPIDVSAAALEASAAALAADYGRVEIQGLVATYEAALAALPRRRAPSRLMMFLGSTIGNLDESETARFLAGVAGALDLGDWFLLGFDLVKPVAIVEAAYNDAAGVTARFNLNMLRHLNRRFDGDFDLGRFRHRAFFNARASRIEMHLVSETAQQIRLRRLDFGAAFAPGESVRTEISRKFRLPEMVATVERHGFSLFEAWRDGKEWYALALFRREAD